MGTFSGVFVDDKKRELGKEMEDPEMVVRSGGGAVAGGSSPELLIGRYVRCCLTPRASFRSVTYADGYSAAETAADRGILRIAVSHVAHGSYSCTEFKTHHLLNRPRGPAADGSRMPNRHRTEMANGNLIVIVERAVSEREGEKRVVLLFFFSFFSSTRLRWAFLSESISFCV